MASSGFSFESQHSTGASASNNTTGSNSTPNSGIHYLPIKFTNDSYLLWKAKLLLILYTNRLMGYVDGSIAAPPQYIPDPVNGNWMILNPAPSKWSKKDQLVLSWIIVSLMENMFAQYKRQLQSLKKEGISIFEYVRKAKSITDSLAAVTELVKMSDLILYILARLGSEYESVVIVITNRSDIEDLDIDDVLGILLGHEGWLEQNATHVDATPPVANTTNFKNKNQNNNQYTTSGNIHGRGREHGSLDNRTNNGG
ncbi:PREDICTED: uncharacterized protein LOC104587318 [Nelumbo nucifera]|uniref:Uncharacterized protein LOC104587318 n=1 Tax=Nelumbo nucifera TaxID=4432 RepID=A0A1U7YV68_NELNU|nr:PREDICTED: uncharacterized protein LOC104587318 [Nelumbo nucifera]